MTSAEDTRRAVAYQREIGRAKESGASSSKLASIARKHGMTQAERYYSGQVVSRPSRASHGSYATPEQAKEAAKEVYAKGWEVEAIEQKPSGKWAVITRGYTEPGYVTQAKRAGGTPVQKARMIRTQAGQIAKHVELVEEGQTDKIITSQLAAPERVLAPGEIALTPYEARKAGLISRREWLAARGTEARYVTTKKSVEAAKTLREYYGDKVLVSAGVVPAQRYYEYHQKKEETLEKLSEEPTTKLLYTIGPGFLGFSTLFSWAESAILGEKCETFYKREKEKIKTWLETPLEHGPETKEFKRWAIGSGFSGGLALVAVPAGAGSFGKVAKFGVEAAWAGTTGYQAGKAIREPTPRNIVTTALYAAPALLGLGIKGVGRVVGRFRAGKAPVSHSVTHSDVFVRPSGKSARGYSQIITKVGKGKRAKYAGTRIESELGIGKTKMGTDRVSGIHRIVTRSQGRTKEGVSFTFDDIITGKDTSFSFSRGRVITKGRPSRTIFEKAERGGPAAVRPRTLRRPERSQFAGLSGSRRVSEVTYPEIRIKRGYPYQRVETYINVGTTQSGKKGIITSRISKGTKGPKIEADVMFFGKTSFSKARGMSRVYSLLETGARKTSRTFSFLRDRGIFMGSLETAKAIAKGSGAKIARANLAKDLSFPKSAPFVFDISGAVKTGESLTASILPQPKRIVSRQSGLDVVVRSPARIMLGAKETRRQLEEKETQKLKVYPLTSPDQMVIGERKVSTKPRIVTRTAARYGEDYLTKVYSALAQPQVVTQRMVQQQKASLVETVTLGQRLKVVHPRPPVNITIVPSTFRPATIFPGIGMGLERQPVRKKRKPSPWYGWINVHPVRPAREAAVGDLFGGMLFGKRKKKKRR